MDGVPAERVAALLAEQRACVAAVSQLESAVQGLEAVLDVVVARHQPSAWASRHAHRSRGRLHHAHRQTLRSVDDLVRRAAAQLRARSAELEREAAGLLQAARTAS